MLPLLLLIASGLRVHMLQTLRVEERVGRRGERGGKRMKIRRRREEREGRKERGEERREGEERAIRNPHSQAGVHSVHRGEMIRREEEGEDASFFINSFFYTFNYTFFYFLIHFFLLCRSNTPC